MAQSIITFTSESEQTLKKIELLMNKNNIVSKNKVDQTNKGLELLNQFFDHLDDESFEVITGFKK